MAFVEVSNYNGTVGYYDGDNDIGKVYDKNNNYIGEYWGHEIFGKDGMSRGYYNGDPKQAVATLLLG